MDASAIDQLVGGLAGALQTRDYTRFLTSFLPEAVFETPFGIEGQNKYEGIEKIRQHFDRIAQSPMSKLLQLESVTADWSFDAAKDQLTVQYRATGIAGGKPFDIPSSVAIIRIRDGKIIYYKDFPNTLGLTKAAGLLPQLAARFTA